MLKKNIYLTQFNTATARNLLPLATGILTSYLKSKSLITDNYNININILRNDPEQIVKEYDNPVLLAYSNYFWNYHYTLHVAKLAKERFPDAIIVFGGPSVPVSESEVRIFFKKYPFVNIVVAGEGEIVLSDILESMTNNIPIESIEGISTNINGNILYQKERKPIEDFFSFPSPFLDGTFDELLKKYSKDITGVVWESNRGCPFSCTFCYWGGSEDRITDYSEERIYRELDWISENKINYIFGADANFGIRKRDKDIAKYIADLNISTGYPKFFIINWNKNSTDKIFDIVDELNRSDVSFMLTVSAQSFNEETLEAVKRKNIKTEHFHNILKEARKRNFNTYTEIILGLPLETYATFIDGLRNVLVSNLNYHFSIYPCVLIPGTEMSEKEYINKYDIQTRSCEISLAKTVTNDNGFKEYEDIIVGTSTMNTEDWQKSYVMGFFIRSLYGFRIVYYIFNYLREIYSLDLVDLFEYIIENKNDQKYKILNSYIEILYKISTSILNNGRETIHIDETDAALLPDIAVLLKVLVDKNCFYSNLTELLSEYLKLKNCNMDKTDLKELVLYQNLIIPSFNSYKKVQAHFESKKIKDYFDIQTSSVYFIDETFTDNIDEFIGSHTYAGMIFKLNTVRSEP